MCRFGTRALIDLHSHILPGIDDGAPSIDVSVAMARAAVHDGVSVLACTPHIMPGVWNNSGPEIRRAVDTLRSALEQQNINLHLTTGADVHIAPNLVGAIKSGQVLTLHDSRYVLLELPHHIAPPRADTCFLQLLDAGYIPIFTHPERLSWIHKRYDLIESLFEAGVWMQITAGSFTGRFGARAQQWSERMLRDGFVHILASDMHNLTSRPANLASGWVAAREIVGEDEAYRLVVARPYAILRNDPPDAIASPKMVAAPERIESKRDGKRPSTAQTKSEIDNSAKGLLSRMSGYFKGQIGPGR